MKILNWNIRYEGKNENDGGKNRHKKAKCNSRSTCRDCPINDTSPEKNTYIINGYPIKTRQSDFSSSKLNSLPNPKYPIHKFLPHQVCFSILS